MERRFDLNELEQFEDAFIATSKFAKDNGGSRRGDEEDRGPESYKAAILNVDKDKNAIYTNSV